MEKAPASAFAFLAAFVVLLTLGSPVRGSLQALDLPPAPSDTATFSAADNQLAVARGVPAVSQEQATSPRLNLSEPVQPTHIPNLLVGYRSVVPTRGGVQNLDVRPSDNLRDEWAFMRRATAGPSTLERLGQMFEVEEQERRSSTITSVHVLAPTGGWLVPFMTVAHESDANADMARMGLGAGAMIKLGRQANLGAEVVHFGGGGERSAGVDGFGKETRFFTRLQLQF